MHRLLLMTVCTLWLVPVSSPAAQETPDRARLVITVAPGYVFGHDFWRVPMQAVGSDLPVTAGAAVRAPSADTFAVAREIRPSLGVSFAGAYYPSEHIGVGAEALLIGLGYEDSCRHVFVSGSFRNASACQRLDQAETRASTVILSGNAIFRIGRETFAPYLRVGAGLALTSQSPVRMSAVVPGEPLAAEVPIYVDERETRLSPGFGIGLGFTTSIGPGYQLRAEVRDNILGIHAVTGPTRIAGQEPNHELRFQHLIGVMVGFDIVLKRRPDRRY